MALTVGAADTVPYAQERGREISGCALIDLASAYATAFSAESPIGRALISSPPVLNTAVFPWRRMRQRRQ